MTGIFENGKQAAPTVLIGETTDPSASNKILLLKKNCECVAMPRHAVKVAFYSIFFYGVSNLVIQMTKKKII